jgi:hypothetical protein
MTAYNINSRGEPRVSCVLRYTIDSKTSAIAFDNTFGNGAVINIGGDSAEAMSLHNGEWSRSWPGSFRRSESAIHSPVCSSPSQS